MNALRRAGLLASLAVLPLLSACGPNCEKICDQRIKCQSTGTLSIVSETREKCLARCEAGFCGTDEKSDLAAECYEQMTCSSMTASLLELAECDKRCD